MLRYRTTADLHWYGWLRQLQAAERPTHSGALVRCNAANNDNRITVARRDLRLEKTGAEIVGNRELGAVGK